MNILNSRDLIKEFEDLWSDYSDLLHTTQDPSLNDEEKKEALKELHEWENEHIERLSNLKELNEEMESNSEFQYGITLIDEDDFTKYVEEMGDEIYSLDVIPNWVVVNWDATAENVKADYSEIEFEGNTYLYRA